MEEDRRHAAQGIRLRFTGLISGTPRAIALEHFTIHDPGDDTQIEGHPEHVATHTFTLALQ